MAAETACRAWLGLVVLSSLILLSVCPDVAHAADIELPGLSIDIGGGADESDETKDTATALKILLALTVLSLAPSFLVVMTSFTRIIVVLSILRTAFGMQQTPPNTVLISLALFLTLFNMLPTLERINVEAFQPFLEGELAPKQAGAAALQPLRDFMVRQTREKDLALMVDVSGSEQPSTVEDINSVLMVPAFMLSELKTAFEIGFAIFIPFLLVDIVVASILMSMGMLMVPPMMISLPIKIMMFVLIDGWNLVVTSLMGSFN
jgi:flagellar biosynthetic protein FliP